MLGLSWPQVDIGPTRKMVFCKAHNKHWNFPILLEIKTAVLLKFALFFNLEIIHVQSTPDNSNLQGKLKMVQVIGSSSYQELRTNDWKYLKTVFTVFDSYNVHFNQI